MSTRRSPGAGHTERSTCDRFAGPSHRNRRTTATPDEPTVSDRLSREFLLLVETPDDDPLDHIRAGTAALLRLGHTGHDSEHPIVDGS